MITKEAIDAALSAHIQWKKRLIDAIETGKSDFNPEVVKTDNACQFGQWLYGLSMLDKGSENYIKVKELHLSFHKIAGDILGLALSGKKQQALSMMESGGQYQSATGKLVLALQTWKEKAK